MSAVKAIAMRHQEDFPVDLFSLNLEDYTLEEDRNIELPLEIDINGGACPLSWLSEGVFQEVIQIQPTEDNSGILKTEEPSPNYLPFATSPPSTPGDVTPGRSQSVSGQSTPGFTPSVSPFGSDPSSPASLDRRSPSYSGTPRDRQTKQRIPRHKRKSHIDAEQRRRSKIQTAFDELKQTVPALSEKSHKSARDSKSAILNKTVEFCHELSEDNEGLQREADKLRQEMQVLTAEITNYQAQLPDTGTPETSSVKHEKNTSVESMFEDYLRARTLTNWKFWIFGLIIRPLFEKFNKNVVTTDEESFCGSVISWVQNHLSLVALRPVLLNTLRFMSKSTSIMSKPEKVPDEVMQTAIESALKDDLHSNHYQANKGDVTMTDAS